MSERAEEHRRLQELVAKERAEREEKERKEQEYRRMLREYPIPEWLAPHVRKLNIAIVGPSGAGKSSLNNRLRGLEKKKIAEQMNAVWCTTGSTECTMFPKACPVVASGAESAGEGGGGNGEGEPSLGIASGVILWDLPGVGTPRFPAETYFRDVGLRHFNCIILVACGRFTENDKAIAEECKRIGKECIYVRTKIDVDVEREEEDNDMDEQQVIDKIRSDLQRHGVSDPFLVSTSGKKRYELDLLRKKALGCLGSVIAQGSERLMNRNTTHSLSQEAQRQPGGSSSASSSPSSGTGFDDLRVASTFWADHLCRLAEANQNDTNAEANSDLASETE
eukprot:g12515.t1